ncbi:M16 family metallopeptidase [Gemmatimonadota bacterium]
MRTLSLPPFIAVSLLMSLSQLSEPAAAQRIAVPEEAATIGLTEVVPLDPNVTFGTLSNGLTYYIRENQRPENRAELRLVVRVGSVVEDDDQLGLAHFVEHMAFNGTEHFEKQELVDYLESLGMSFGPSINASTGFDETTFMLRVPTDDFEILDTAFLVMEDWAKGLSFDHGEIDRERGVIVEEWRMGRGAGARMRDEQIPILFKDSRYAERLPIGDPEIIRSFEYDTLKRFYHDWYRPDLMAIVAVGDFDAAEIENLIRGHFEGIELPAATRPRPDFEVPDHEGTLFAIATDEEAVGTSVSVLWKQPPSPQNTVGSYRERRVISLFNGMLNRRFSELTQQADPPFLGASSSQSLFVGSKEVYSLDAATEDDRIETGLEALLIEAERVARFGFTETELERLKTSFMRGMERSYDEREKRTSASYASEYIRAFTSNEPIPGIEYEYELYKRFIPEIAVEEVNRLAGEWITDTNRVIMVSAPEKEDLQVPGEDELLAVFDRAEAAEITPYVDTVGDEPLMPFTPEPGEVVSERYHEETDITEWELANGMRVILKPTDFKRDEILMSAWSWGGSSLANDENHLSAESATLFVTQGGLGDFNLIDLGKKLTGKVASATPSIGRNEEGFSGSASPKDLETLFQLINLRFTSPRADSTVFVSLMTRMKALIENMGASPQMAFSDTLSVTLSNYHPWARPMTVESLDAFDLQQAIDFYQDRFADASDFTFLFVGNLDLQVMRPLVERYLGSLPALHRQESWRDIGLRPPRGVVKKTVRRGREPQSQTAIIFTGEFEYTRENNHTLSSMVGVLDIMLREKIREELGGTYGVNVGGGAARIPEPQYSINVIFGSDPERLDELVEVIFDEMEKLKAEGPSEENMQKVTEAQRRSRETNLKENSYWIAQIEAWDKLDGDYTRILNYEELIDAITPEMVREAARLYLDMENYIQVSLVPEEVPPASEPSPATVIPPRN